MPLRRICPPRDEFECHETNLNTTRRIWIPRAGFEYHVTGLKIPCYGYVCPSIKLLYSEHSQILGARIRGCDDVLSTPKQDPTAGHVGATQCHSSGLNMNRSGTDGPYSRIANFNAIRTILLRWRALHEPINYSSCCHSNSRQDPYALYLETTKTSGTRTHKLHANYSGSNSSAAASYYIKL